MAELGAATRLAQPRVSTHLAKLREAGLLRLRRAGTSTFHALQEEALPEAARKLLGSALDELSGDALLEEDEERLAQVVAARQGTWADAVAGRMERHYSPGRTWEAAARSLVGLARFGDVLDVASGDGALAELVAPRARTVTCLDKSPRVVEAAHARLGHLPSVRLLVGDMHALPFGSARFDQVMLLNALSHADDPPAVVREAAAVLRPGGALVLSVLAEHRHEAAARAYDHRRLGFRADDVATLVAGAGLAVESCAVTSRERRTPHFAVITCCAHRPADAAPRAPAGRRAHRRPRQEPSP